MEKVVVAAYASAEVPPLETAEIVTLNHRLLDELDAGVYPGLALQVEDFATTQRWMRRETAPPRRLAAVLALWTEAGDDIGEVTRLIGGIWPDHAVSVVTEAVPRWWTERTENAAEPQPGLVVTSALHRSPAMTHDEFVRHWVEVHQPISLRVHPQRTYVRNVVARVLVPADPQFDAVSEEGVASAEDILDPSRYFGADAGTWEQNAALTRRDVQVFLDSRHNLTSVMYEYRLREIRPRGAALNPSVRGQS